MMKLKQGSVIAATRTNSEFKKATESDVDIIFDMSPDILTLSKKASLAHKMGKKMFIHLDFAKGIGKDKSGIEYAMSRGTDGIISTKGNIIKAAKDVGITTVQRFFIIDSISVDTTLESFESSKADMVEIMPGISVKAIGRIRSRISAPVIAGGLIEDTDEVRNAFLNGATAVSTGREDVWNYKWQEDSNGEAEK